jgi:hypothetical protein
MTGPSKTYLSAFLRGLLIAWFLTGGYSISLPVQALELASSTRRITRTSINSGGGVGADPVSSTNYKLVGSLGENSAGALNGTTRKVADGLMKIYYYPGTITTVALSRTVNAGEISLTWNAPGADGARRTATSYVIKYSTHPAAITDQDYFENTATLFGQTLAPQTTGLVETFTLTGLTAGTSYYVAIEARDEDKNQGYLSNSTFTWAQAYVLGVDISNLTGAPKSYGFGAVTMSSAVVSTSTIRVSNTGTVASNWSLRAATTTAGSPWQLTRGALGQDLVRLSAGFHTVQPSSTTFSVSAGNEDRLITTDALSTGTTFTIDGSTTGVSVPVGASRKIWFLLETPPVTSTTAEQSIQVTVTANP